MMKTTIVASSISLAFALAVGCSSASSPSTLGGSSAQQSSGSSGGGSSSGKGSSSGGSSSSSGGSSSGGSSSSSGGSSSGGSSSGDAGAGGTCGSKTTGMDCGNCCYDLHPGAQVAQDAWDNCACGTPGTCATACATSYCSQDGGAEPQPGDACDKCLQGASQCDTAANQACSGNADCQAFDACMQAAGCDSKP